MRNVVGNRGVGLQGVELASHVTVLERSAVKLPAMVSRWLCVSLLVGGFAVNSAGNAWAGLLDEEHGGAISSAISSANSSNNSSRDYARDYVIDTQITDAGYVYRLQNQRPQLVQAEDDVNDPIEGFNRAIFSFNQGFYKVFLGPVSEVYTVLPSEVRSMIGGVLSNLSEPVVFINDILQGEFDRALSTLGRFIANSVFGLGGMFDMASEFGLEKHSEDFGQTLAVWGVGEGFYLVLPILGPSNPRDLFGRYIVDPMVDPVSTYLDDNGHDGWILAWYGTKLVHDYSEVRDDLELLDSVSVDYYAAVRSLYRQQRRVAISNGEELELPSIPDFTFGDYIDDPLNEPSLGQNNDPALDDQVSYFSLPQLGKGDITLDDPFAIRFDALEVVGGDHGIESSDAAWDSMPIAPRKPTIIQD